ncbi:MAG: GumC family protein [Lentisphaeria bacterium]
MQKNKAKRRNSGQGMDKGSLTDIIHPKQYLAIVAQYWWLVLLIVLAGVGAGAAYSVFATPLYRATCRYELFRESSLMLGEDSRGRKTEETSLEDEVQRQIVIMNSRSLHNRVHEQLENEWGDRLSSHERNPNIDIKKVRAAKTMVDINVDASNPEYAEDYLNQMLDSYKSMRREEIMESSDTALENLRREQDDVKRELDAARDAVEEFRQEHNLTYTRAKSAYDEQFLSNLIQRENTLRMEKTILDSQFEFLKDADTATIQDAMTLTQQTQRSMQEFDPSMAEDIAESSGDDFTAEAVEELSSGDNKAMQDMDLLQWSEETMWQEQQAEKQRLESEYEYRLDTYRSNHPEMINLKQEIEAAERDLNLAAEIALKRLNARYDAVELQLDAVKEAAKTWRKELDLTTQERAEYAKLASKIDHLEELHDRVYKRILDGSVINVDALFSRLIEPPRTLSEPVWPAKAQIMILALVGSLALGVGGAFTLDHFDTRFLDVLAIEERLNLPYISGIPNWRRVMRKFKPGESSLLLANTGNESVTETYRALRTAIDHRIQRESQYVLLVTSGDAGEGKTMTALNLAMLYASSGKKVLLVDGDLRRGKCHRSLERERTPGLCEFFLGRENDWTRLVQKTDYDNLDFIPSGQFVQEVPELLSATRMTNLTNQWRKEYDMVLVDSAPASRVTDTSLFADVCDGVMLVVNHSKPNFAASVRHTLHRLPDANLIGFCLNSIDLGHGKYNYYTRYGGHYYGHYAYSYGYYYSDYSSERDEDKVAEETGETDSKT